MLKIFNDNVICVIASNVLKTNINIVAISNLINTLVNLYKKITSFII